MKNSTLAAAVLTAAVLAAGGCAKTAEEPESITGIPETSTVAEETGSEPAAGTYTNSEPAVSEKTTATTKPAETGKQEPAKQTTKAVQTTKAPKPETAAPPAATTKPTGGTAPVSGSIDSGNAIAYETTPSGHYNNNIKAYYSGNVLVCGDFGLEYFSLNSSGDASYAAAVNRFAAKYPAVDVSCMLVPKSGTFNAPKGYTYMYPNHLAFVQATYSQLSDNIKTPDCMSICEAHKGEYLFYRTDHHWTSLGAYYASVAYCNANGITPRALSSYKTVVNTGYVGSLYGFCASPKPESLKTNPDYTVGHLPNVSCSMTYTDLNGRSQKGPVIDTSAKSYAGMFICGDQAFADIRTSAGTGKKLIVFKESYGNAFVPFMADYFDEIAVIDIRHFKGSVSSVISEYGITHALIINNLQGAGSHVSELNPALGS